MTRPAPLLVALCALLAGCGADRVRPSIARPEEIPNEPSQTPLIRITVPTQGAVVLRDELIDPPGLRVLFSGVFVPGHEIELEGRAAQYGPIPFFQQRWKIPRGATAGEVFFRANKFHLDTSTEALLFLRVYANTGALLSADSVSIRLK